VKIPHPLMCSFCFFGICGLNPPKIGGYCDPVPPQLGAESDRAPCPTPVVCDCCDSLPKRSRVLPSPSRLFRTYQRNPKFRTVLAGLGAYISWSGPLHTCTVLFVPLSSLTPHFVPCSLTSHFFTEHAIVAWLRFCLIHCSSVLM
jgi:hypothetical protein